MTAEFLLVLFAALVTIAFLVQVFLGWRLARTTRDISQRLKGQADSIEKDIHATSAKLREISEQLSPITKVSQDVQDDVTKLSGLVHDRLEELDEFVGELTKIGQKQATKIDYVVTDTVSKFEDTRDMLQRDLLRPATEISALVRGIRSGLDYLFTKKPVGRGEGGSDPYPEEEMFI